VERRVGTAAVGQPMNETGELFEGDMWLTEDQLLALQGSDLDNWDLGEVNSSQPSHNAIKNRNYFWPRNTVKFAFNTTLRSDEKTHVRRTLENLQTKLNYCIRFVESIFGPHVVVNNERTGCWSWVGAAAQALGEPYQKLNLQSDGCMSTGTIEHEFLHTVGLYHTQSRSDRDNYVEIIWANIGSSKRHNFNKYSSDKIDHFNLPYDYKSIMHYGARDFGNGQITIRTLDPTKQNVIGKQREVSAGDIELVKKMYSCEHVSSIAIKTGTVPNAQSDCRAVMELCDRQRNCCQTTPNGQGLDNPGNDRESGQTDIYTNRAVLGNCAHAGNLVGGPVTAKLTSSNPGGDNGWFVDWARITMSTGAVFSCPMRAWLDRNGPSLKVDCHISGNPWLSSGRCGSEHLLPDGRPGQCDPNACCSASGWCGNSPAHCDCDECVDYRPGQDIQMDNGGDALNLQEVKAFGNATTLQL